MVDLAGEQMVHHLENNLKVRFKGPWKRMNSSLPWQQEGLVTLRKGNPSFPN